MGANPRASLALGERRNATILFSDLSGYTAMSERLDPEEVEQVMREIKSVAAQVVEAHGGLVNQFIGDEVVALFGIPVAHGNDPLRAVTAAHELHRQVAMIDAAWRSRTNTELTMHSSVNTGLIVVLARDERDGRFSLTGDTVNTGARLMALAGRGELVVGAETHRQVADHFVCEALAPVAVRGKAQPLVAYRVGPARADRPLPQRALVGRDHEIAVLRGVLRQVIDGGRGATVHVRGDAGLGKSRLCREIQAEAGLRGVGLATGLVLDFGVGRGRDALTSLVGGMLGVPVSGAPEDRRTALYAALESGADAEATSIRPFACDIFGLGVPAADRADFEALDAAGRRAGRLRALAFLAQQACRAGPLLLLVEDLHWADRDLLAHLAALAELTSRLPLLLLTTSRPEADPTAAERAAWRPAKVLELAPLAPASALALAAEFSDASERFATLCVERAAGNPMFLEQLLLGAEEALRDAVPGSVQSVVLARVDHLAERDRAAIQAASVLGQQVDLACWRHVLGDSDYSPDALLFGGLLVARDDVYMFGHALIQEGVYQSLVRPRRRALHERAAQWWSGRDTLLWAQHLARAEDPRAAGAFLDGARQLLAEHSYAQARQACAAGLQASGAEQLQFLLLIERASAEQLDAAVADSIASYRQALEVAEGDAQTCRAWLGIAQGYRVIGPLSQAAEAVERALPLAVRLADQKTLSQVHHLRGNLAFPSGQWQRCREEHTAALAYARQAGDVEAEANALSGLADAAYLAGMFSQAREAFSACVAASQRGGLLRIQAANLAMLGCIAAYVGPLSQALAYGREAVDLATRIQHFRARVIGAQGVAIAALELGDFEFARERATAALEDSRRLGARLFESESQSLLARALLGLGDVAAATELLDLAWQTGAVAPEFCRPLALGPRLALLAGAPGHAERVADARALLARGCPWFCAFELVRGLCAAAVQRGDIGELQRAIEDLTRLTAVDQIAVARWTLQAFELQRRVLVAGVDDACRAEAADLAATARGMGFAVLAAQVEVVCG